jgi:hypothetical protein
MLVQTDGIMEHEEPSDNVNIERFTSRLCKRQPPLQQVPMAVTGIEKIGHLGRAKAMQLVTLIAYSI